MPNQDNESEEPADSLLKLMQDVLQQDKSLRDKYSIGDKFRFIRDRLNLLLTRVQENVNDLQKQVEKKSDLLAEDEILVYVYLFNAQGLDFKSWQKMLSQSVFYEYSVNRPIYRDIAYVQAFLRTRKNRGQHGFLTIAVKKQDVLGGLVNDAETKDMLGNPIVKVKEGSLHLNRMFSFTHNEIEYVLNDDNVIVKKQQPF